MCPSARLRPASGSDGAVTGIRLCMTVTDPDTPDPMNDPRTTQADPGTYGQGADLASTGDDPAATGEDELAEADDAGAGGLPVEGGVPSSGGVDPEPDINTGAPFTQVPPEA
jgi:hypothetical protein